MHEWRYSLSFQSPVSIFSGLAVAGLVDRMVIRDGNKLPYIPGSSVKGRWRFHAERLLHSCDRHDPKQGLWVHKAGEPICKKFSSQVCTICSLFGGDGLPALLWVGEAGLTPPWREAVQRLLQVNPNPVVHPDAELRPGVALDRYRRTALADHLFFDEALPATLTFAGTVLIKGSLSRPEREFLTASARSVDRLGGRKAVGRGLLQEGIVLHLPGGGT